MKLKYLDEADETLRGRRVLLRLDLNVPLADGKIVDDFRIRISLPTIEYLKQAGAKVIILSHLGDDGATLKPVADYLGVKLLPLGTDVGGMSDGEVVMLDNLRQDPREKSNGMELAQELASLGDIYVNDAFAVCHRRHASIVSLPTLLPSFVGLRVKDEVTNLATAFTPDHPFLLVLGGAKFETKIGLVKKFLGIADNIFICGAVANNILRGENVPDFVRGEQKIVLPVDLVDEGADMGEKSLDILKGLISNAKHILWNGPSGRYEDGYRRVTEEIARAVANSGARTVVGGGDTLAVINNLGIGDKFSFVSSGGGAMLDFLSNGTLPGLEALTRRQ